MPNVGEDPFENTFGAICLYRGKNGNKNIRVWKMLRRLISSMTLLSEACVALTAGELLLLFSMSYTPCSWYMIFSKVSLLLIQYRST
jgi:hypothetical protein